MSVVAEAPGYLRVFSDGSVKRFEPETIPASTESSSSRGYTSKDVIIDQSKPITGRLFRPNSTPDPQSSFPVIVYFHGGGFCIGSTTWLGYHHFLGDLSVASQSIILSIDYRLAPENRLPVAYDDSYTALDWLRHRNLSDPWLEQADLSQVFLSGDSAGANIAHNIAIKAIRNKILNITIDGLLLIHPYFGSEKRTEKETSEEEEGGESVAMNDMFWRLSIPEGSNRDYYGCNYEKAEVSRGEWGEFPRVVVYVAELDFLKERGEMYAEFLEKKGVKAVKVVEAEGESHVFHVFDPQSESTRLLQKHMSEFIKSY